MTCRVYTSNEWHMGKPTGWEKEGGHNNNYWEPIFNYCEVGGALLFKRPLDDKRLLRYDGKYYVFDDPAEAEAMWNLMK